MTPDQEQKLTAAMAVVNEHYGSCVSDWVSDGLARVKMKEGDHWPVVVVWVILGDPQSCSLYVERETLSMDAECGWEDIAPTLKALDAAFARFNEVMRGN